MNRLALSQTGWGDGSDSEAARCRPWGPELDLQNLSESLCVTMYTNNKRTGQTPEAHWPASLAESMSHTCSNRSGLKKWGWSSIKERHQSSISGLQTHKHSYTYAYTNKFRHYIHTQHKATLTQSKKCRNLHWTTTQAGEQRNIPFMLATKDMKAKLYQLESTTVGYVDC